MKEKTVEKINRRLQILPLHSINTEIFIEALKESKLGDICIDYLNRVGYKYRGSVSLSVLGEFLLVVLRDTKDIEDKELSLRTFDRLIKNREIEFSTPKKEAYENAIRIINIDSRIGYADALNYAIAVQDKADVFVSFDSKLVENKTLEKEFRVKIIHPSKL